MKQTLNEEINRIKSMMGCCKGKITENIEAGSQQEAEMIQIATQEIEYLGITQEDLNENNNDSKLNKFKEQIANETLYPFLQNATKDDLKEALKELLQYKKEIKNKINSSTQQNTSSPEQTPINEQVLNAAGQIKPGSWLDKLLAPLGVGMDAAGKGLGFVNIYWVVAWLICGVFKCYIYSLTNYNTNIINRIVAFFAFDFKNIFTKDPLVKGCGRLY